MLELSDRAGGPSACYRRKAFIKPVWRSPDALQAEVHACVSIVPTDAEESSHRISSSLLQSTSIDPDPKPSGADCGNNTVIHSTEWATHTIRRLTVSQWVVECTSVMSDRGRRGDVVSENPTLREETGQLEAKPGLD